MKVVATVVLFFVALIVCGCANPVMHEPVSVEQPTTVEKQTTTLTVVKQDKPPLFQRVRVRFHNYAQASKDRIRNIYSFSVVVLYWAPLHLISLFNDVFSKPKNSVAVNPTFHHHDDHGESSSENNSIQTPATLIVMKQDKGPIHRVRERVAYAANSVQSYVKAFKDKTMNYVIDKFVYIWSHLVFVPAYNALFGSQMTHKDLHELEREFNFTSSIASALRPKSRS